MATQVTRLPIERAPLLTEQRVRPLPVRRRTRQPPGAGWLAPVFQLRPTSPPRGPYSPPPAA